MNNQVLKILAGVALIMVILASGVVLLRTVALNPSASSSGEENDSEKSNKPTAPEIVSTSPPPVTTKHPIQIPPDHPLQPAYKPINQPAFLQFLRQEKKTYHSKVVGKVSGRASKRDWGVRGVAYFDYLYAVESRGKIVSNNGVEIVEERHFGKVHENLFVSGYEIGIQLPEKLDTLFDLLNQFGDQGEAVARVGRTATQIVNNIRLPVKKEWVEAARQTGVFSKLPQLDPQQMESELRMFSQGSDNRLLEGKTVRIVFIDGKGVVRIEPVGCSLSEREQDIIIRTNFVMDHYLFPDKEVKLGEIWVVEGNVFSGFLDPRLHGKVSGNVEVIRTPDFIDARDEVSKRLKIRKGTLTVRDQGRERDTTGQISGLRGVCVIPDKVGVVTAAHFHGYADYKKISRDHLLFAAETTFTPRIDISYECSVE